MLKIITLVLTAFLLPLSTLSTHAAWEQPKLGYQLNQLKKPVEAPNFKLEDIDEYEYDFSEYRGKVDLAEQLGVRHERPSFWAGQNDKQGRIRYRAVGGREFDLPKVEKIIQTLMQE